MDDIDIHIDNPTNPSEVSTKTKGENVRSMMSMKSQMV
jgi:hypothetical protein